MFRDVDESTVMLGARVFNESPLNSKECCLFLVRLLYFLNTRDGFEFSPSEATLIFFSITKAFQSKDMYLRRLVYLAIKELAVYVEDAIMATSSLVQDVNSGIDVVCRSNALRTLCRIGNHATMGGMERLIKQAITDPNKMLASAAIVSCLFLYPQNTEMIKRIVPQDIHGVDGLTRYQLLGLMFMTREHDWGSIYKLFKKHMGELTRYSGETQLPLIILLLRVYQRLKMERREGVEDPMWKSMLSFVSGREAVSYETSRVLCELDMIVSEMEIGISVLQSFLGSNKPLLRFAAIRTLNRLADKVPRRVAGCNMDLEHLISDSNRSISTLAMTTLLKTGNESSMDRLMGKIQSYMVDMSDELKMDIIDSIKTLAIKFPKKHELVVDFFENSLRDQGSMGFKKGVVQAIKSIASQIPECEESVLNVLCEFVEDCEYEDVATDILHFVGQKGIGHDLSKVYLRHVYNRLFVETDSVLMASVGSLIGFASKNPNEYMTVVTNTYQMFGKENEEVLERINLFLSVKDRKPFVSRERISLEDLENRLVEYMDRGVFEKMMDVDDIPLVPIEESIAVEKDRVVEEEVPVESVSETDVWAVIGKEYEERLGRVLKRTAGIELTEPETEYNVQCIKHVFSRHLLLEYQCRNTVPDTVLFNVSVSVSGPEGLRQVETWSVDEIGFGESGNVMVLFECDMEEKSRIFGTMENRLVFRLRERDSSGNLEPEGFMDEYELGDLNVSVGDFMVPVSKRESSGWKLEHDGKEVFSLPMARTISKAMEILRNMVGPMMEDGDGDDGVSKTVYVEGKLFGEPVGIRLRMVVLDEQVSVEIVCRSTREETVDIVLQSI